MSDTGLIEAASAQCRTMADGALYERLVKRVSVDARDCWNWTGCVSPNGYGGIQVAGAKQHTHRAMYAAVHGRIEGGMYVCHRCDNRRCVNPAHLFLGTAKDNAVDRSQKGRSARLVGLMNPVAKLSDSDIAKAITAVAAGKRVSEAARELSVTAGALRARGVRSGKRGVHNGRAKLTLQTAAEAKALLRNGVSQSEIGRRLGVSSNAIWRIANGRSWL